MNRHIAEMIPPDAKEGIDRYVGTGEITSSFLIAVMENNLKEAFLRVNDRNIAAMRYIVSYVYWEVPAVAWGSPERVTQWVEMGGKAGRNEVERNDA